jgi:hypothetical protein
VKELGPARPKSFPRGGLWPPPKKKKKGKRKKIEKKTETFLLAKIPLPAFSYLPFLLHPTYPAVTTRRPPQRMPGGMLIVRCWWPRYV